MRILALVVDAFGGTGGISQYNRDLISAWAGLSTVEEIVVLPRLAASPVPPLGTKIVQHQPVASAVSYAARAVAHSALRRRYDVVFCGHLHMMPLALMVSRMHGAPVWLQIHGLEAWAARRGPMRWCVERADLVTSVSRHTRRLFLGWADLEPTRVVILPNTVGDQFTANVDRQAAKEKLGLSGRQILLTVSRLARTERYKGHAAIIRGMPEIARTVGNVTYIIAGEGDLKSELQDLVRSLKLEHLVVFTGAMARSELATLYAAADVYVMPSSGEGFGIVYLEALACGVPVIAGDSDGARDPLHDGRLGTLTDEEHLTQAVLHILERRCERLAETRDHRTREIQRYFGRAVFNDQVRLATGRFAGNSTIEAPLVS